MITITSSDDKFIIDIKGFHQILTLKSKIIISKNNIVNVYQSSEEVNKWSGIRIAGTYFPFLIVAGVFYKKGRNFWDVSNTSNAIIIELKNETFHKLFLEVKNPKEAIALLLAK